MRQVLHSRTLWTFFGVASRIAQGLGLHRDGRSLGLSYFETEMRRRLWWQIIVLDFRSGELTGLARMTGLAWQSVDVPSNVNDADMYPEMTDPLTNHEGSTEMVGCLLRYEFGRFMREKVMSYSGRENADLERTWIEWTAHVPVDGKDRAIDELERRLEEKFLRYCDLSVPVQFHASIVGRSGIAAMRLLAHHPRKYGGKRADVPDHERKLLWSLSTKVIEYDNICHSSRITQRFRWHVHFSFNWPAFIYLLDELGVQTVGEEVEKAWQQIEEVYEHHSDFITHTKQPLHVAVGNLCLKAYRAREQAVARLNRGTAITSTPKFIVKLWKQRQVPGSASPNHLHSAQLVRSVHEDDVSMLAPPAQPWADFNLDPHTFQVDDSHEQSLLAVFPTTDISTDWPAWDYLLQD